MTTSYFTCQLTLNDQPEPVQKPENMVVEVPVTKQHA